MKKFRGKKRYFRNLWEEVNTFDLQLDHDSWVYFWHTHLDFFWSRKNKKRAYQSVQRFNRPSSI